MPGEFTVGVEEEYQLVSPSTWALRSRAREVLETDWSEEIRPETQQTMLEVGTDVCASAVGLGGEIRRLRLQAASAAAAEELRIVAAGLHPFSRWQGQAWSAGERYRRILERYGRVLRTEHIFGMHVHVAVPEGVDRARVMTEVREYTPHLLALSASSPFYEGEDTGYASYRAILAGRLPHSGPPPRFASMREYREFIALLLRSGAIEDEGTVYWSVRPHSRYPTVEFRVCDVCPRVEDAVSVAALARALVAAAAEGRLRHDERLDGSAADALIGSNEWQAARFGLDAVLADPAAEGGRMPVRDAVQRLLDRLHPVAEALGDGASLARLDTLLGRGNAADRMRAMLPYCGDLPSLVEWTAGESLLGTGLDRRSEQREACA